MEWTRARPPLAPAPGFYRSECRAAIVRDAEPDHRRPDQRLTGNFDFMIGGVPEPMGPIKPLLESPSPGN
jgi:hypothetical protein